MIRRLLLPCGVKQQVTSGQVLNNGRVTRRFRAGRPVLRRRHTDRVHRRPGSGPAFYPPSGAVFGLKRTTPQATYSIPSPDCDWRCRDNGRPRQTISVRLTNEYFVYWADGDPVSPHYIVIAKHSGSVNPTASRGGGLTGRGTLTWEGQSKGYLMHGVHVKGALSADGARAVSLLGYGPQGSAANQKDYRLDVPVLLRTRQSGSRLPQSWSAGACMGCRPSNASAPHRPAMATAAGCITMRATVLPSTASA